MEKYSKNFTNGKIILIVNFCICYSEVISCRHLLQVGEETNHNYPDAVYKIYPIGSQPIMAYCDMSRDGGGWTLLVTSHTNSWTAQNVKLRNANSPKLTDDYNETMLNLDRKHRARDVQARNFPYKHFSLMN